MSYAGLLASLYRISVAIPSGILVAEANGRIVHRNPALQTLLAGEPQRDHVEAELERLVGDLAASVASSTAGTEPQDEVQHTISTTQGRYRVWGMLVSFGLPGGSVAIVVGVDRQKSERISNRELRERFRLTPRECQVARMIARGDSDPEISAALGISRHTAEHHTEHVLAKLAVRRRSEVYRRLTAR